MAEADATRDRLLLAAADAFARLGFDGASTRDICAAADANPAAINYHFGSKRGLYEAVLAEPLKRLRAAVAGFADPAMPIEAAVRALVHAVLQPLRDGIGGAALLRLVLQETASNGPPAGQAEAIAAFLAAADALVCRAIGVAQSDRDTRILALSIIGMGRIAVMARTMAGPAVADLARDAAAIDHLEAQLVLHARTLLDAERRRRARA
jgi:AcrR family transcriptional regulator